MSFEVEETALEGGSQQMTYTYRLVPGPTAIQKYGLRFAKHSGLPSEVLEEARAMCDQVTPISEASFACLFVF